MVPRVQLGFLGTGRRIISSICHGQSIRGIVSGHSDQKRAVSCIKSSDIHGIGEIFRWWIETDRSRILEAKASLMVSDQDRLA